MVKYTQKFLQNYDDDDSGKGYIFEVNVRYHKRYRKYIVISCSCLKIRRLINAKNFFVICMTSTTMSYTKKT